MKYNISKIHNFDGSPKNTYTFLGPFESISLLVDLVHISKVFKRFRGSGLFRTYRDTRGSYTKFRQIDSKTKILDRGHNTKKTATT